MFKQSAGVPEKHAFETLSPEIPKLLPHNEIFNIKVQNTEFPLSGASLSSDGPSYFTVFFERYLSEPPESRPMLRIDRSADVFKYISAHLQGYYIRPMDDCQLFHLYADVIYYRLPRLEKQLLREDILTRIGSKQFVIPRSLFSSPGDLPNYFSLGFTGLFSHPKYTVPGGGSSIIRPPPMRPPSVSERSAKTFAELLEILYGAPVEVKSRAHREHLLSESRYFHFRGLEQKIVAHKISYNAVRKLPEITIVLLHTSRKGTSLDENEAQTAFVAAHALQDDVRPLIQIKYARPFTKDSPSCLILQVECEHTIWRSNTDGASFIEAQDLSQDSISQPLEEGKLSKKDLWEGRLHEDEYKKLCDIIKPVVVAIQRISEKHDIQLPSEKPPIVKFSIMDSQLNIDDSTPIREDDGFQDRFDLSPTHSTDIRHRKRVKLDDQEKITTTPTLYVTSAQYRIHIMLDLTILLEGIFVNAYTNKKGRNAQQKLLV